MALFLYNIQEYHEPTFALGRGSHTAHLIHVLFHRYRGTYNGYDVCIRILRITDLNSSSEVDFLQQALILRQVFCRHN
jgi:hypothetical protein